jgi:hypothetical protein
LRMDEVWPNNKSSDYDVQDFYIYNSGCSYPS